MKTPPWRMVPIEKAPPGAFLVYRKADGSLVAAVALKPEGSSVAVIDICRLGERAALLANISKLSSRPGLWALVLDDAEFDLALPSDLADPTFDSTALCPNGLAAEETGQWKAGAVVMIDGKFWLLAENRVDGGELGLASLNDGSWEAADPSREMAVISRWRVVRRQTHQDQTICEIEV